MKNSMISCQGPFDLAMMTAHDTFRSVWRGTRRFDSSNDALPATSLRPFCVLTTLLMHEFAVLHGDIGALIAGLAYVSVRR